MLVWISLLSVMGAELMIDFIFDAGGDVDDGCSEFFIILFICEIEAGITVGNRCQFS